jgi:two-component system sensor histidine kinase HydH
MVKEVDRMNRVVTDLLTFARPLEAELAPTDLQELLEHVLRLVNADAQGRGVEIHKNISENLPAIDLDANQVTQCLLNLTLNALQALDAGGSIEVGATMAADYSKLLIWVEDDGSGIPAVDLDKVFDPFFTTREQGTGLGLAIVHTIVENHNGEIRVQSPVPEKNKGARFTISIPI